MLKVEPVVNPDLKKIVCYNLSFPKNPDLEGVSLTVKEIEKIEEVREKVKDLERGVDR